MPGKGKRNNRRRVTPFDPLAKVHLGDSVATALLRQPVIPLEELAVIDGSGIYALYYTGNYSAYGRLLAAHREQPYSVPIYVGKAVPRGARIGEDDETDDPRTALPDATES